jgi:diguanylate cyclase (GGDEF)-like protein
MSPDAAELRHGTAGCTLSPQFEAAFVRARLSDNRTLIRVVCTLAVLLAAFRGTELAFGGVWHQAQLVGVNVVLMASIALTVIAWSPAFERIYLPVATIIVPIRNAVAAALIGAAAAYGQPELLMLLPFMVLGPFFFLGLSFRTAIVAVALTVSSYFVSATIFEMTVPTLLRSCLLLIVAAAGCAIAARQLEKWSRKSFLESHLLTTQAHYDALTGLKNRRVFDEHLSRVWQQAVDDRRTIAILLIDVDHFKAFNDSYGHQAGDRALKGIARTLRSLVSRPLDLLARYGGEEFVVILFDVNARGAEALANRMRGAVSERAISNRTPKAGTAVTISIGVAVVQPSRDRQPDGALQLADQALYEAKVRGRNRVELMDEVAHAQLETGVFASVSLVDSSQKSPYVGERLTTGLSKQRQLRRPA